VPGNYRGVTLLNVIGKIYARVLNTRLAAIAEPRIAKEQAGFITGRSTVDQVFILSDVIGRFRANGKNPRPLYIAFLDIAKAYDTRSGAMRSGTRWIRWACLANYVR
jgi:hypothetical protein